jgi:hypothetical protein
MQSHRDSDHDHTVCMYVRMYVRMYIYVFIYVFLYVYMHVYINFICIYVRMYVCMYVFMYARMHADILTHQEAEGVHVSRARRFGDRLEDGCRFGVAVGSQQLVLIGIDEHLWCAEGSRA